MPYRASASSMTKCLLPALLLFLSGCATIMQGSKQKLLITSDPPGALVTVDGIPQGPTPLVATVARKRPHTLSATIEGFSADSQIIKPQSRTGLLLLNLLMLNPYGFVLDLATGAHNRFPEDGIRFQLASLESVAPREAQHADASRPPEPIASRDSVALGQGQRASASRLPLPIGGRVRVVHGELPSQVVTIGTLREFSADTLVVESTEPWVSLHRIPLASATSISLSMGSARGQSSARGAGRGALGGLLLGALVGTIMQDGGAAIFLGGFGAMGGVVVGGAVGAVAGQTDEWKQVCCTSNPATSP